MKAYQRWLLFLMTTFFLFNSCKKDNNGNNIINPPGPCVSISGYTGTDITGALTGPVDSTDWGLMDTWSQCEMDSFGGTEFNTACTFHDSLLSNPIAYPNPTSGLFSIDLGIQVIDTLAMYRDSLIKVELLIVNQQMKKLLSVQTNKYKLRTSTFTLGGTANDSLYRVYYRLIDTTGCVRLGHGDILKQ